MYNGNIFIFGGHSYERRAFMIPKVGDRVWLIYVDWVTVDSVDDGGRITFEYGGKKREAYPNAYRTMERLDAYRHRCCNV